MHSIFFSFYTFNHLEQACFVQLADWFACRLFTISKPVLPIEINKQKLTLVHSPKTSIQAKIFPYLSKVKKSTKSSIMSLRFALSKLAGNATTLAKYPGSYRFMSSLPTNLEFVKVIKHHTHI